MPETQTMTTQTPNPDAALLSGGPLGEHGKPMPKEGEPHPDLVETQTKYELNGKTFSSAEEMSKYVADLEKKVIDQPIYTNTVQTTSTKQVELIDGQPLDQLLFTNPARALKYIEDRAEQKVNEKLSVIDQTKKFWSDFYTNNPDLRGKEEIVDALVAKNWNQNWANMNLKDFSKVAADTTRSALKKVGLSQATEVPSREAGTLSPSGEVVRTQTVERRETSMVDEMREARARRLKAKVK